jgi:predicted aldo/keto reductase-like oxidoreductase
MVLFVSINCTQNVQCNKTPVSVNAPTICRLQNAASTFNWQNILSAFISQLF